MKKRVTSQDVADLAGVSRTTVSFVINDAKKHTISPETRQKVLEAIEELGYVPDASARALATQSAKAIGLIMNRNPQYILSDTFLPQIVGGLLSVVNQHQLSLLVEWVDSEQQVETYQKLIKAKHIDGLILLTPLLDDKGLKELEALEIPAVVMGELEDSNLSSVDIDNRLAAQKAVQHLINLGHRKIACITNAKLSFSSAFQRLAGYKDALAIAGIEYDEALVQEADFDPQSGYDAMDTLLDGEKNFTGVFVASDNVAIGALSAIRNRNLSVPEDLSLIGFDDLPWSKFTTPPLTTIHLPAQQLAQNACFLLLEQIQDKNSIVKHLRLDFNLINRNSTTSISC